MSPAKRSGTGAQWRRCDSTHVFIFAFIFCVFTIHNLCARPATDTTNPYYGPNYERAHFPNGDSALKEYIRLNTNYPLDYADSGIQGRTVVRFIVDEKGRISDIKVVRGIGLQTDAQAICVVSDMPVWVPARYKKKPVKSVQFVGISFRLY